MIVDDYNGVDAVAYCEFMGKRSFAGYHYPDDPKKLILIDLNIHKKGWLPPHEVKDTMKQATLLVHPSIGLGDAVPTVIKESMALGTPVVASSIAGIPELLDDGRCGVLVPPRNVEALAGAIQGCLDNEAMRRKYADTARQYAEQKFDTWRNGLQLAEVIRSTKKRVEGSTREYSHE